MSNTRLVKNTVLLYVRQLLILGISLYTSRQVLLVLGEDDYGVYNIVGGVVVLFTFLTSALSTSTQRYISYYLESENKDDLYKTYSICTIAHWCLVIIIFILSESIGLWFVNNILNIPENSKIPALWVYQTSVISMLFSIITVPYRSSVIACEDMGIFAMLSILETIMRLGCVMVLLLLRNNILIWYSVFYCGVTILLYFLYRIVCLKKYDFCRLKKYWDKKYFFEIISFSGWYLLGGAIMVSVKQGVNILLNIFYSVAINAATGIANQVRSAVYSFVSSFQTAFNPQLIKLYASGKIEQLIILIWRTSKFSFFLMVLIGVPIIVCCNEILKIWLKQVPLYTSNFTIAILVSSFLEALSAPLWITICAIGKVKNYQIGVSLILFLALPISYGVLKLGLSPVYTFWCVCIIDLCAYIFRLLYLAKCIDINLWEYIKKVIFPCLIVTVISLPSVIYLHETIPFLKDGYWGLTVTLVITIFISCVTIVYVGLNSIERKIIKNKLLTYLQKNK